jgi:hypothetical protein
MSKTGYELGSKVGMCQTFSQTKVLYTLDEFSLQFKERCICQCQSVHMKNFAVADRS